MTGEEKAQHVADCLREFIDEYPKEVFGYKHQLECTVAMFEVIADRFARREKAA